MDDALLSAIPARKSHYNVKSGEEMMDVLIDDINRYEALAEREELLMLSSLLQDDPSGDDEDHNVNIELHELPTTTPNVDVVDEECERPRPTNRYKNVTEEDTDEFILQNRNKNTSSKTKSDLKMFLEWCQSNGERRNIEDIPMQELDGLLARFYLSVRRRDGNEYEPDTLTGVMNSIDRYLKDKKVQVDIKKEETFFHSRRVLEAKRKELKAQGKGNKKQRAESLEAEEIKIMYKKQLLGAANPTSLLNTVWLNNGVFFGFRGRQEHSTLLLGDLEIKNDATGREFVEFNERCTKTRNGAKMGDQRQVTPKMFSQPDNDYCPVKMLKTYISRRPQDLRNDPKSRFYLRPLQTPSTDVWYSHQPVGKNKLGVMMKSLAMEAEIMGRKVNHSTRKTFASTLLESDRPNTEVAQLGGWKNVSTLTHYNVPSIQQQKNASNIISETVIPVSSASGKENTFDDNVECEKSEVINKTGDDIIAVCDAPVDYSLSVDDRSVGTNMFSESQSAVTNTSNSNVNPCSILYGASVTGGTININIFSGKRKFDNFE